MLPTTHIVFSADAVDNLREAVRQAGRLDRVIGFQDDLGFGPINPPDPDLREAWVHRELGYRFWYDDTVGSTEPFWREALEPGKRLVAWTSRRSVAEYAGFLEWLRRLGDLACEVVDLTETMAIYRKRDGSLSPPTLALSAAHLRPEQIVELGLLDSAQPLDDVARQRYRNLWNRLRGENAPLRILADAGLESAEVTFFDAQLLENIVHDWRKSARVISTLDMAASRQGRVQVNAFFLAARLRTFAAAGKIESQGNPFRIRYSEVRLPRGETPPAEATS